jgi:iron complex transport system substrate-binding protein
VLTRRQFLLSSATLAALTACGGTPASTSGSTAAPAGGNGYPRTVRHEQGATTLEAAPAHVVCGTDGSELCSTLALGVQPVGYGRRYETPPPWLAGLVEDLDEYDLTSNEVQYERLVAWEPDVLLVQNGFATAETMPRFSEIAPTIATSFIDWRDNLRQVSEALGLEDRAAELVTEKDAAIAAARGRLTDAAGLTVNVVNAFDDGSLYVLNDRSPAGKLASALGLASLPPQQTEGEAIDQISREQLDRVDGDLLLVLNFGEGDGSEALEATSLWQGLDVVRAGNVVNLTEDESQQLYFDAVLTVEPNVALLERAVRSVL